MNAGTVHDHEIGFRRLVDAGVNTAIVSVADLGEQHALAPYAELVGRFANK